VPRQPDHHGSATARREQERHRRRAAGLAELDRWLLDRVRAGLAHAAPPGRQPSEELAARMVDAQLPGVARTVRQLAVLERAGDLRPAPLLEELALLHLLACSPWQEGEHLPAPLVHSVRAELGLPVTRREVLAAPPVTDVWQVLAQRQTTEQRLTTSQVWLHGRATGQLAEVRSFGGRDHPVDDTLNPGDVLRADLHHHPAATPLRALVGEIHERPGRWVPPSCGTLGAAFTRWADAVVANPWTRSWPVLVTATPVVEGDRWWLVDTEGSAPLLDAGESAWVLLAESGGVPVPLLAEVVPGGLRALALLTHHPPIAL